MKIIHQAAHEAQNDYLVRQAAEEICSQLPPKDYISEPIAIGQWVHCNTRYMRDPRTVELVRSPSIILKQIYDGEKPSIDCDDMAALICALCMAAGCKTRCVTVAFKNLMYNGQRQYTHVFAQGQDPKSGLWITLDPVAAKKMNEMMSRIVAAETWMIG